VSASEITDYSSTEVGLASRETKKKKKLTRKQMDLISQYSSDGGHTAKRDGFDKKKFSKKKLAKQSE
jgi:hypothetical protein